MTCPQCGVLLAVSGNPHCPKRTKPCGWVNCRCGQTVVTR